jgi:hypothetical protein
VKAASAAIEASPVEREIPARIAAAGIRLRFDKSFVRLVDGLKASLAEVVPDGQALIITVSAPIKRRARTAAALESLVRGGLPKAEVRTTIEDNQIRLRRVTGVPARMPRVIGFVHNPESDAGVILAMAEAWLRGH